MEVGAVVSPRSREALPGVMAGAALLAGGTWLFSEPQPGVHTLVDLCALGWPALEVSAAGLRIGATCTIAALEAFEAPAEWAAAPAIGACCRALLGSFKVANTATVGGNVCLALPAAPMLALTVALDGVAEIWHPAGERRVPMAAFALGERRTVLQPGEVLRGIDIPAAALRRRASVRQAALTALGRSAALVVGTRGEDVALTVTASTIRPIQQRWAAMPRADQVLAGIPDALWFEDVHGSLPWRRHMTRRLAADVSADLA